MSHPILTLIALVVVAVAAYVGWRLLRTGREKAAVRGAFQQYLSPGLVEALATDPASAELGSDRRKMTVMCCRLPSYDALAAAMQDDLEGLAALLNRFYAPMTEAMLRHQGTLDKYLDGGFRAFWNAPQQVPDHAVLACRSALAMVESLQALNRTLQQEAATRGRMHRALSLAIGIETGDCLVGNFGSPQRFDYTVLGPVVSAATALAGQAERRGVDILIGEGTQVRVPILSLRELDPLAADAAEPVRRIFALLGERGPARA